MYKIFLMINLMFGLLQTINAQHKSGVLIISKNQNISVPSDKFIKKIIVKKGALVKKSLHQQCIDLTKYYKGNCFKVTYLTSTSQMPVYLKGEIYKLNESEFKKIQRDLESYKSSKPYISRISERKKDSKKLINESNLVFQLGGESKLALLPKYNYLRKHNLELFNPYYGIGLGLHPLFVTGTYTYTLSVLAGIEKSFLSLETSLSHFNFSGIKDETSGNSGSYSQNLLNLKLGFTIKENVKLKLGKSFILSENEVQVKGNPNWLFNMGRINNSIYGIEIQLKVL